MEDKAVDPIKILRSYAHVIEIIGIAIGIIVCMIGIVSLIYGGFIELLICVVVGVLLFLCSRVLAAFIEAYANKCEDVHNIYMFIGQNTKNGISDNQQ